MSHKDCSPQIEDGYVRIANELFEALSNTRLPGRQWQIVLTIIRMTYGYNRKTWNTSNIELSSILNMHRQHTHADLKELAAKNMILVTENGDESGITIGIQKHYLKWDCNRKRLPSPKTVTSVTENGDKPSPKTVTVPYKTKDNSKDTLVHFPDVKKSTNGNVPYDDIVNAWNEILGDTLPKVNPKLITDTRRKLIAARWHQSEKTQSIEWWREFFQVNIADSEFLMGRAPPAKGRTNPFRAKFDWVFELGNFVKIVEGNYE